MKTTVELPDQLLKKVKSYASRRKRTFKDVLIEALKRIIAETDQIEIEPEWKNCFGRFQGSRTETAAIQNIINKELDQINPKEWE